ncbi:MAG: glycosyltransferase family 2 protein [Methanomassiliicoccales archaeon]|nr:glycosyltransferase family 2 protein [Methanomassiliicoccales archaeon]
MEAFVHQNETGEVCRAESPGLVSVIIPTYNRPELLARAIRSAIGQTYRDLEIIVVDDGSQRQVVEGVGDTRVKYLKHESNEGVSAARNTGIHHSSGRYIAFLDDDDEWMPEKTELQLEDLKKKGSRYKVSYCLREIFRDENKEVIRQSMPGWDGNHLEALLSGDYVPSPSLVLLERECLEKVGVFREDLRRLEDREFLIRLAKYYDFACLNRALVRYHVHTGGRISDDLPSLLVAYSIVYKTHKHLFLKDRRSLSKFLLLFAYFNAQTGNRRRARLLILKSIVAYPFRLDPYVSLILLVTKRLNSGQS